MDRPTPESHPPAWPGLARLAIGVLAAASLSLFLFYEGSAGRPNAPVVVAIAPLAR